MLKVALATEIGGLNGANPLELSMPVMIAPMSYGALSASTKRAVGLASTLSGIAENTGEGGMSDAQRGVCNRIPLRAGATPGRVSTGTSTVD